MIYFAEEVNINDKTEFEEVSDFLKSFEVVYSRCDLTMVVRHEGAIVATGSVEGNTLKYFFVHADHQHEGLARLIFNGLVQYLSDKGYVSYFAFTTPENILIFAALGMVLVYNTERACLMEGGFGSYSNWISRIQKKIPKKEGRRGAVVMNCNPMTNGHRYLVETASKEVSDLLVFVVQEDSSLFPFEDRYRIVKNELKEFPNVHVLMGGPYIISKATFPTYFIKKLDEMLDVYTGLDGGLFIDKIARDLEIDVRFFGSEPTDEVTEVYNSKLRELMKKSSLESKTVERLEKNGIPVSASVVRKLLTEDKIEEAYGMIPENTVKYLESEEGKELIWKMKREA